MAEGRTSPTAQGGENGEPSQSSNQAPRGPRTQRPANSHLPLKKQNIYSSKELMKRIRDLRRKLGKDYVPMTVRMDLEQELKALHARRGDKKIQARRTDMISRYHMVRFFERKKAMRRLKHTQKLLEDAETPKEKARLEKMVHMYEVDMAYAQYHPHLEPYVSIWPTKKTPEQLAKQREEMEKEREKKKMMKKRKRSKAEAEEEKEEQEEEKRKVTTDEPGQRGELWHLIEQAMTEGTAALEKIRDRKDAAADLQEPLVVNAPESSRSNQDKSKTNRQQQEKPRKNEVQRKGHWQEAAQEEEDDGEGFFN